MRRENQNETKSRKRRGQASSSLGHTRHQVTQWWSKRRPNERMVAVWQWENTMCEWSHIYDESEWPLTISLTRFLKFLYAHFQRVVLSRKYAVHAQFAWSTCCSNQQSLNEARFRDGSVDRWDVDQGFPRDGTCTMFVHFPKRWEPSALRNPQTSAQLFGMEPGPHSVWGSRWPKQSTVHECFVNCVEVVSAAIPPCSTLKSPATKSTSW